MKKFQSVFSLFLVLFFLLVECGVGLAQKVDLKMSEGPLAMYKKPFYLAEKKEKVHYLSYAYNKSTTYTFLFLTFDKETANIQSKKWIDLSIKAFPEKPSNFIKSYDRVEVFTCLDGYLIPKYQETREGASIYSLSKFSFYGQLLYEKPLVDEKGDPIFTSENRSSKLAKTYWDEDKKQFMVMTYESYTPNICKYFYYDEKGNLLEEKEMTFPQIKTQMKIQDNYSVVNLTKHLYKVESEENELGETASLIIVLDIMQEKTSTITFSKQPYPVAELSYFMDPKKENIYILGTIKEGDEPLITYRPDYQNKYTKGVNITRISLQDGNSENFHHTLTKEEFDHFKDHLDAKGGELYVKHLRFDKIGFLEDGSLRILGTIKEYDRNVTYYPMLYSVPVSMGGFGYSNYTFNRMGVGIGSSYSLKKKVTGKQTAICYDFSPQKGFYARSLFSEESKIRGEMEKRLFTLKNDTTLLVFHTGPPKAVEGMYKKLKRPSQSMIHFEYYVEDKLVKAVREKWNKPYYLNLNELEKLSGNRYFTRLRDDNKNGRFAIINFP